MGATVLLASPASDFIGGAVITVDGGCFASDCVDRNNRFMDHLRLHDYQQARYHRPARAFIDSASAAISVRAAVEIALIVAIGILVDCQRARVWPEGEIV